MAWLYVVESTVFVARRQRQTLTTPTFACSFFFFLLSWCFLFLSQPPEIASASLFPRESRAIASRNGKDCLVEKTLLLCSRFTSSRQPLDKSSGSNNGNSETTGKQEKMRGEKKKKRRAPLQESIAEVADSKCRKKHKTIITALLPSPRWHRDRVPLRTAHTGPIYHWVPLITVPHYLRVCCSTLFRLVGPLSFGTSNAHLVSAALVVFSSFSKAGCSLLWICAKPREIDVEREGM